MVSTAVPSMHVNVFEPYCDGNAQDTPFGLVCAWTLPSLPRIAAMLSRRVCLHGAVRRLQYVSFGFPLATMLLLKFVTPNLHCML